MAHESESDFQPLVRDRLIEEYGEDRVYEEKVLPVTDKRVDLYVETPSDAPDLAFETEDDWSGVEQSHGQLTVYADQLDARPFIVVPKGHVQWPEVFYLNASPITIVGFPDE